MNPPAQSLALISADALIPMQGDTLLHHAGAVVDPATGRITAVGALADLQAQHPNIEHQHFPGIMLPGFINAHVHLELGYQRGLQGPPAHFTQWVAGLIRNYPPPEELESTITRAARSGAAESLAAGVTCVGDISRHSAITRRALAAGPLRVISYGEVVGLGKMRGRLPPMLETAADPALASKSLRIGLSPHAPYTVEGPCLAAAAQRAIAGNLPLAMHLAELPEEAAFLRDCSGPLGRGWDLMVKLDVLDDAIERFDGGPIRWARHWGLLGESGAARQIPVLLAHVNDCDAGEIAILAASGASVAYCPRTHDYFGHHRRSPHPYRFLLAAGVNVCLGTDSLASNPDLNILKEAQLLHQRDALPPLAALEMITVRAADALGLHAGRIQENALADIIIMPTPAGAPSATKENANTLLAGLLAAAPAPSAVWIAGRRAL